MGYSSQYDLGEIFDQNDVILIMLYDLNVNRY